MSEKVSWVRHRDIHLLTVGRYTYTSDQRFQSIHSPHTEDWKLQVRYPQRRDSGIYECQVSTTPPIGHSMYLSVVELPKSFAAANAECLKCETNGNWVMRNRAVKFGRSGCFVFLLQKIENLLVYKAKL
ncbi:hypothetical protein J437_LFUL004941 [Ladona fulva]|uniref:Ig-like domain-containing protein n=1 Tax=Ladona fulva TaxID=123851 RepID=A0A8K0KQE8_LADFU|nr:hypothetical protein J437_LFUL004941 [Ladona fulva]